MSYVAKIMLAFVAWNWIVILTFGCIHRWEVDQLTAVCSQIVDEDGWLIVEDKMFGKSGARKHLRENIYSYTGVCK